MKKMVKISADRYGLFNVNHLVQALKEIGVTVYEDPLLEEVQGKAPSNDDEDSNIHSSGVEQFANWILVNGEVSLEEVADYSRRYEDNSWFWKEESEEEDGI